MNKKFELLLVEDNMDEVILFEEALEGLDSQNINFNYTLDGIEAMQYIQQLPPYENKTKPDLVILDLNMPKKNGHEVLREIKTNAQLKSLPVIIFSTSQNTDDIIKCYKNSANSYISKPTDFGKFENIVRDIEAFWFKTAQLPDTI